jgi:hypothetical protein
MPPSTMAFLLMRPMRPSAREWTVREATILARELAPVRPQI